jgi:hypothetical protein
VRADPQNKERVGLVIQYNQLIDTVGNTVGPILEPMTPPPERTGVTRAAKRTQNDPEARAQAERQRQAEINAQNEMQRQQQRVDQRAAQTTKLNQNSVNYNKRICHFAYASKAKRYMEQSGIVLIEVQRRIDSFEVFEAWVVATRIAWPIYKRDHYILFDWCGLFVQRPMSDPDYKKSFSEIFYSKYQFFEFELNFFGNFEISSS